MAVRLLLSLLPGICFLPLAYFGVPLWAWIVYAAVWLGVGQTLWQLSLWLWVAFGLLALMLNLPWLRQRLLTAPLMRLIERRGWLPQISETERAAIEAGTVWVDGELFSGKPDIAKLMGEPDPVLTEAEQAFLDGPVETVCQMATDWEIHQRKDLPPDVWNYLRQEHFFGMMIPPEYGGLGFSNAAYSAVMVKLASRSFVHTATVGVTNSLGPAKLLLHYGTPTQKQAYLPSLARGEAMPCFALTEPNAGSDAASLTASGTLFSQEDGKLYLRLNWKKRYITLGAIATLIGLAFRLQDPDNLLGKGKDVGITCALVPADTPGVTIDRRHDPMGVPFYNSPIEGRDVVIPASQIIGGLDQAGRGWRMLMQTLAAGRGVSFPATCTGIAQLVTRVTGAYATVRHQFGLPIGRFEGVTEPLAEIGGLTYLLEAARRYTVGAVDRGEQPAVVSAIAKYQFTERSRQIVNDGMDILGGAGICRGPRNLLANIYTAIPIPITVEGANILTRSMIIFGQGVIRAHPQVFDEITALENQDLATFDRALWQHLGTTTRNLVRAIALSLTQARLVRTSMTGTATRSTQKLIWSSALLATLTDLALLGYGGRLKRQEAITGRFADALSGMYLATSTLHRYTAETAPADSNVQNPAAEWALKACFYQVQLAFEGLLTNLQIPVIQPFLLRVVLPWLRWLPLGVPPTDAEMLAVAQQVQNATARQPLTAGMYIPTDPEESLGRLERAFALAVRAQPIFKQVRTALRESVLAPGSLLDQIEGAMRSGLISGEQADMAVAAIAAREDAIQVDAFALDDYLTLGSNPSPATATAKQSPLRD
ncbi:MAG: acyl-CoA dehydrogenase [Cyanobacteria bacterium P01_D01_bin.14]